MSDNHRPWDKWNIDEWAQHDAGLAGRAGEFYRLICATMFDPDGSIHPDADLSTIPDIAAFLRAERESIARWIENFRPSGNAHSAEMLPRTMIAMIAGGVRMGLDLLEPSK